LVSLFAVACSGDNGDSNQAAPTERISVQLDWTPNTNHIGIYVALANGWYDEAGLDVEVLPYADANADVIVANGQADIGVSFPPSVVFSRAAGLDVVSVAAVMQTNVTELAVLASSDIQRPRDFDGRLYAGFGLPFEAPQIRTVIQADGGRGEFETATLSTAAYEALYNERADFTEIFTAWEGVEAQLRGIDLRTFRYDDYGVPDIYSVVLVAAGNRLDERADVYQRFLDVTRRGYEHAAASPEQAARTFLDYMDDGAFPNEEMVRLSADMLAGTFLGGAGRWGGQTGAMWGAYSDWLVGQGVVTGASGDTVSELDSAGLFTTRFLGPDSE
jgi:ABC-type nitrate/sulfonate/bicarbonate transport system substrate-binding protein